VPRTRAATFLAYTALTIPLVLIGVKEAIHWIDPLFACVAVNPGGKEYVCGGAHTPKGLRVFWVVAVAGWIATVLFGCVSFLSGALTRGGKVAWSASALLFVLFIWGTIAAYGDATP